MTTTEAELTTGAEAPDLKLSTPEGAPIQLSMLWKEKPLVLVFLGALEGSLASENAILWRDAGRRERVSWALEPAVPAALRRWHGVRRLWRERRPARKLRPG